MFKRAITVAAIGALALGSAAACSSSRVAGSSSLPTVKVMVGGIDKQIYLPVPARPEPRLLQEVRRQRAALHRGQRRRRRRGRDGLRAGRHGRRLVHPHHRLPVQGQGRRGRRPALRGPGRAGDVRHQQRRPLRGRLQGQDPRRHRPRVGHRRADPVPGARRRASRAASTTPSPSAPAPPRSRPSSAAPRSA